MSIPVKICGLSTPESVIAARDGGASHLGFIFFVKSPRHVSPEQARDLVALSGDCQTVAVSVDADDAYLDAIVGTMEPDLLQLHGSESLERVAEVKSRYGLPVMKALAVRGIDDLARAQIYEGHVDLLLLDAKPPKGAELPGGNGVSFDWSLVENLQSQTPILLSGGIDQSNVKEAIALVRDAANGLVGLDLSSGVESAPGVKDMAKIAALLEASKTGA
ncbi:phosphoribosylanthranilate isomerase [Pseudahrensia aquimaris]|uniref:N-(5'-phosphoribosyl)anthranilate isomerase n=1 Tax=Pseudahrensia aquimaris TaxID=744461 RepID=A0ABW3FGW6_9HYPH